MMPFVDCMEMLEEDAKIDNTKTNKAKKKDMETKQRCNG